MGLGPQDFADGGCVDVIVLCNHHQMALARCVAPGAVKLVPLLLFLPGMYRDNLRSYIWLCFLSNMYFVVLVQRAFATPSDPLVIVGLVAVVALFTFAMLYVRWRARDLKVEQAQPENES